MYGDWGVQEVQRTAGHKLRTQRVYGRQGWQSGEVGLVKGVRREEAGSSQVQVWMCQ